MNTLSDVKPNNLFRTPTSFKEIQEWIEKHPAEDRLHLYTAAMMTYNLFASALCAEKDMGGDSGEHLE